MPEAQNLSSRILSVGSNRVEVAVMLVYLYMCFISKDKLLFLCATPNMMAHSFLHLDLLIFLRMDCVSVSIFVP